MLETFYFPILILLFSLFLFFFYFIYKRERKGKKGDGERDYLLEIKTLSGLFSLGKPSVKDWQLKDKV